MRYKIYNDSSSRHCCFSYTIVDTEKIGGTGYYENICETFYEEQAILICRALNFQNSGENVYEIIESDNVNGEDKNV